MLSLAACDGRLTDKFTVAGFGLAAGVDTYMHMHRHRGRATARPYDSAGIAVLPHMPSAVLSRGRRPTSPSTGLLRSYV